MRFRFIDRVISFEKGEKSRLVIAKTFPSSDEFTLGHPQRPGEVPTCLVLETLATSGVRLIYDHTDEEVIGVLLKVEEAKIFRPILAGEQITVQAEILAVQSEAQESVGLARTYERAFVGDHCVAEARLILLCFPKNGLEASVPW